MEKFKNYYKKLITEQYEDEQEFELLVSKTFEGDKHTLKVSLLRFKNDFSPRISIISLDDPKLKGYVEYDTKSESIIAYNGLLDLEATLNFMNRYQNKDSNAFNWKIIIDDENSSEKDEKPSEDENIETVEEPVEPEMEPQMEPSPFEPNFETQSEEPVQETPVEPTPTQPENIVPTPPEEKLPTGAIEPV